MTDTTASPRPDDGAAGSPIRAASTDTAAETADRPPRCIPAVPLHKRQLTPDMVELQRAGAVAHRYGQGLEGARLAVAVCLALAGIVVTLVNAGTGVIAVLGFLWFLGSSTVLRSAANRSARTSALLQEQFDTGLFTCRGATPSPAARSPHTTRPRSPANSSAAASATSA
jgi:hypothetical protein